MNALSGIALMMGAVLVIAAVTACVALPARLAESRRLNRCRRADPVPPRLSTSSSPVGSRAFSTRRCPSGLPPQPPETHNEVRTPVSGGHAASGLIHPRRKHSRALRDYCEEFGSARRTRLRTFAAFSSSPDPHDGVDDVVRVSQTTPGRKGPAMRIVVPELVWIHGYFQPETLHLQETCDGKPRLADRGDQHGVLPVAVCGAWLSATPVHIATHERCVECSDVAGQLDGIA